MTAEPSDLATFKERLGQELVAASHRQHAHSRSSKKGKLTVAKIGIAVAAALIAAGLLAGEVIRVRPASADVFTITVLESEVQLDVVDVVTDPSRAQAQLLSELNLEAELIAVPTSPELEGNIVAVGSDGTIAPELVLGPDNRVDRITLPQGFNHSLLIEFGRPAKPGETYHATTTAAICRDLWGQTASQATGTIVEATTTIRYETIDAENNVTTNVSLDQIPPDYKLVDIIHISSDELLVTYAAHLDARPQHPNCQ